MHTNLSRLCAALAGTLLAFVVHAQQKINGALIEPGTLPPAAVTAQPAGTVLCNNTGSSAVPTACTTIPASTVPTPTPSTLGGVNSAAPVTHQYVTGVSTAGAVTTAQPSAADVTGLAASATTDTTNAGNISSGTLPPSRLPMPTGSTLGGVESATAPSHNFSTGVNTSGVPTFAQPTVGDISGIGSAASQPSSAFDAAGAAAAAQTAAQASSLQKASNLSDVSSASTARTNLGLGSAATQASSAFDTAGSAAAAQTAAQASSLQKSSNLSDLASPATALANLITGANINPLSTTLGAVPTVTGSVVTWGDSLTYGYTPYLATLLSPTTVVNNGVPGQSVTQIGVRQGALPTLMTATGGTICSSGGNVVTFLLGYEPITNPSVQSAGVTGMVAGQHGTLTESGSTITFTCDTTNPTTLLLATPFYVDQNYRNATTELAWFGHNNGNIPQFILWNMANSLAANVPPNTQYAFLSNTFDTGTTTSFPAGTFGQIAIQNNNYLLQTFGAFHYIYIVDPLIAAYNSSYPPDATDHGNGIPPTSVRLIDGCGTITGAINASVTSIPLSIGTTGCTGSNGTISVGEVLVVDTGSNSEGMVVTAISASSGTVTATVTRGWNGTAASHSSGVVAYATDNIHFGNPCIAGQTPYQTAYPSAPTICGYQIIANTVQAWLAANHPPTPASPFTAASADGLMTTSAGVRGTNPLQSPIGTTKYPVEVTAAPLTVPGTLSCGNGYCTAYNNITTSGINYGVPQSSANTWLTIGVITGSDYILPQNGALVNLGNSSNSFYSADIAHLGFFNSVLTPDTTASGTIGSSSKSFGGSFIGNMVSAGTKFSVSGCSATTTLGGSSAGKFTSGTTGTCTVAISFGNTSYVSPNGYSCRANDLTTPADTPSWSQTVDGTAGVTMSGTTVSGDVVNFSCIGY